MAGQAAWRETLGRRYPTWHSNVAAHTVRARPRDATEDHLIALRSEVDRRAGMARAQTTWAGIATVLNQFEAFELAQTHPSYHVTPLDTRICMWVQHKIWEGLELSSAVTYLKKLRQMYKMVVGEDSFFLQEFAQALRKDPRSVPEGTRPLTREEMKLLLDRATSEGRWAQLFVQWATASRTDDLHRLSKSQITVTSDLVVLTWDKGTKSGTEKRVDAIPHPPERLVSYLRHLPQNRKPFPMDAGALTTFMRRALALPAPDEVRVSSHSIKKGALVALLRSGVPINLVMFKAKHSSEQNLQTYVGAEAWAAAHEAAQMSDVLRTMMDQL